MKKTPHKIIVLFLFVLLSGTTAHSQECSPCINTPPNRYLIDYPGIVIGTPEVTYTDPAADDQRTLRFYAAPQNVDPCEKRPLLVILPGSGFVEQQPYLTNPNLDAIAHFYADKGYAVVTADYHRVEDPCRSIVETHNVIYKAAQQVHSLLQYMVGNQNLAGIDPDHIYLFGSSAGGIAGITAAYADEALLNAVLPSNTVPASKKALNYYTRPQYKDVNYSIRSFAMVSSAMPWFTSVGDDLFTNRAKNHNMPIMFIHGIGDETVQFNIGPSSLCKDIDVNLCGSQCMANLLEAAGICYELHAVESTLHSLRDHPLIGTFNLIDVTINRWLNARLRCQRCESKTFWYSEDLSLLKSGTIPEENLNTNTPAGIHIFPNPATDQVTFALPKGGTGTYTVINSVGQTVGYGSIENQLQIDVSELPVGTYNVVVHSKDKVVTERFIKQ